MFKINSLRKDLEKAGLSLDFYEPDEWLSTGIYTLNQTMSGKFSKGIPNRRSVLFWGESGTGKSFLVSMAAKAAQDKGYFVFYLDSETSMNTDFLERIGVDVSDKDKFLLVNTPTVADVVKTIAKIFKTTSKEDKIFIALDSISNLETKTDSDNFDKGESKGDQGQLAKQLKKMVKSINAKMGERDMFFVMAGHAYQNQEVTNGEGKWLFSGGKGVQFIPSIGVLLTRLNLKDDTDIVGIKLRTQISKSRFAALGGKSEIELNYEEGFDAWAGLLDMGVKAGIISQAGAWYSYTNDDGEVKKFQRKNFGDHYLNIFDVNDDDQSVVEDFSVETDEAIASLETDEEES